MAVYLSPRNVGDLTVTTSDVAKDPVASADFPQARQGQERTPLCGYNVALRNAPISLVVIFF